MPPVATVEPAASLITRRLFPPRSCEYRPLTTVTGSVTVSPSAGIARISSACAATVATASRETAEGGERGEPDGRRGGGTSRRGAYGEPARSRPERLLAPDRSDAVRSTPLPPRDHRPPGGRVPTSSVPDGRLQRRAPRQRPAAHRRRGPPRAGRRDQRLVRRRLEARAARQDRLRAPVRARDVPGLRATSRRPSTSRWSRRPAAR